MDSSNSPISLDEAGAALRQANLRRTASRIAVLQYLSTAKAPLSHAEVADHLTPQGYDKSTLYRCLVEMAEAGLLFRLELGDHAWRFEFKNRSNQDRHSHIMCVDCGKVACLPDVQVQITPPAASVDTGFALDGVTEVLLRGRCEACH